MSEAKPKFHAGGIVPKADAKRRVLLRPPETVLNPEQIKRLREQ